VTIAGPLNVPALLPTDASELYARNLLNFLTPHIREGNLSSTGTTRSSERAC